MQANGVPADFARHAVVFGLTESDYGAEFVGQNGDFYTVAGFAPRSRKYPVLATRCRDGKTFKFPARFVVNALAIAAA
ncbi:MAG: hypothetical protein GY913_21720 [Proteobacteria bacterium]|nr:hypothetical protein [Actinomycetes bacterium]MCP4919529.1 hypothetical protein [Pseudomonadota bacterium]